MKRRPTSKVWPISSCFAGSSTPTWPGASFSSPTNTQPPIPPLELLSSHGLKLECNFQKNPEPTLKNNIVAALFCTVFGPHGIHNKKWPQFRIMAFLFGSFFYKKEKYLNFLRI